MKKPKRGKVPAKKTKPAKALKAKGKSRSSSRTNGSGKPAKGPRSQSLPGMEQVRVQELDNLAESLGEIRQEKSGLEADEKENLSTALSIMHDRGINSYRFAKIEYLRSPGEEKIRARMVKDRGRMAAKDVDENVDTAEPDTNDSMADAAEE